MKDKRNKTQKGQVSRLLLVLAIVVFVAVIIIFLVLRMAEAPPKPVSPVEPTVPQPVYLQTLGDITFTFDNTVDLGNVLKGSNALRETSWQKDLTTTEKFIRVTIGAQNIGKENIEERSWDIGNIIDSEGRIFLPVEGYVVAPWLPDPDFCSVLLKPAFQPTPCSKIYEVSKKSAGLKVFVVAGQDNTQSNFSSGKVDEALIDLIFK